MINIKAAKNKLSIFILLIVGSITLSGCSGEAGKRLEKGFSEGYSKAQEVVEGNGKEDGEKAEIEVSGEVEILELKEVLSDSNQIFTDLQEKYLGAKERGETSFSIDWSINFKKQLNRLNEQTSKFEANKNDPNYVFKLGLKTLSGDLTTLFDEYENALSGREHESNYFETEIENRLAELNGAI